MDANRSRREGSEQHGCFARCGRCFHRHGGSFPLYAVFGLAFAASLCVPLASGQASVSLPTFEQFDPFAEPRMGSPGDFPLATPATNFDSDFDYSGQLPNLPRRAFAGTPDSVSVWGGPRSLPRTEWWTWQLLPDGLVCPSYLAGTKESRFASVWNHDSHLGWMWDLEAGGRVGLVRYGTEGGSPRPDGWQLDLEGAAFPRLDLDHDEDLISVDFRAGVPLTFGRGPVRGKLAAYHLSSHLGDEFMLRFPEYPRINYSRDAIVLGGSYYVTDDLRLYAEAEWAWYTDGGTKPWEFQFGLDYSPVWSWRSRCGAPFVALNGQLREEVDYGGDFIVQAGWQWRGDSNHLFRVGVQYFTGKSDQFQFFRRNEEKVGIAMWYDY
jgi:hypothetical protein